MLLDTRSLSRSYVERKGLQTVAEGHLKGDRNYTNSIHQALTLELTHRTLLDGPESKNVGERPVFANALSS
jgi:hypothetical protein